MNRRDFLRGGMVLGAVAAAGCDPTFESTTASQTTVLGAMIAAGRVLSFGANFRDGRAEPFVIEIDGLRHDPKQNKFWIFLVNGAEIDRPPHEYPVPKGARVEAVLTHWQAVISTNT